MARIDEVLEAVSQAGLTLCRTSCGNVKAAPTNLITPSIRRLIKSNKEALVLALAPAENPASALNTEAELERQLIDAALRACDYWGDSLEARAEMLADLRALPHDQRQGWLEYFLAAYGKAKG